MNAALPVVVAIALALAPVFMRRPTWAVFAFSFLLLLHANLVLSSHFGVGLADPLLFGAMLGLVAVYPLLHGDSAKGSGRFLAAGGFWLVAILNSYLWSTATGVSVLKLREFLPNVLYGAMLFLLVVDQPRLLAALAGVLAATVLLSTLTLVQVCLGITGFNFYGFANGLVDHIAGQVDAFRPRGPVEDPNYYAQILVPGYAIALGIVLGSAKARWRGMGAVATIVILTAILLTASRGGLIAMAMGTVALLLAYRKIQYLAAVMVPGIAVLYLVPSYYARVTSLMTSLAALASGQTARDISVSGRLAEMKAAAILFAEHPVSGIGFGMFETRYQDISANYDMMLRGADRAAHSLYLETAAEQGVIGLAALMFLLGASLRAIQLAHREAVRKRNATLMNALRAMAAAAVGLFVSALFLHDAYAQHFWLVLALLFAAERTAGDKPIAAQPRVDANV